MMEPRHPGIRVVALVLLATALIGYYSVSAMLTYARPPHESQEFSPNLISVNLDLDHTRFLVGELIRIDVRLLFSGPGTTQANPWSVCNCLELTDASGVAVPANQYGVSHASSESRTEINVPIYITSEFSSPGTWEQPSSGYLRPGQYTCKYACSEQMSSVWFEVLELPDSLAQIWAQLTRIKDVAYRFRSLGLTRRAALDTIRTQLTGVFALRSGFPLRAECLDAGLFMFSHCRATGVWNSVDSLDCARVLMAYGQDSHVDPLRFVVNASSTVYAAIEDEMLRANSVIQFARTTGDIRLIQAAEDRLENLQRGEVHR
jgi:hypothetical protein